MSVVLVKAGGRDIETILLFGKAAESRMYHPMKDIDVRAAIYLHQTFLITEDGGALGFIVWKNQGKHIVLDEFLIEESCRGNGLGSRALELMLGDVQGREVRLMTHPENPAVRLYRRHRFEHGLREEDYYGDGEPRIHMRRAP